MERSTPAAPTATLSAAPTPIRRITPSASSLTDDTIAASSDSQKTRSPYLGKKPRPKRTNSSRLNGNMENPSDGAENPNTSYFEHSPTRSQFIGARGRPLSFYDMKEQQKQVRPGATPSSMRNSWRASHEMPYNYADIIGGNRYSYAPPTMGRRPAQQDPFGPSPGPPIVYMGLPWTMWMNSEVKNMFVASVGEWVGTTLFLFFAFAGTQVANAKSRTPGQSTTTNATAGFNPVVMLYIAVSFGFSLMVNVWIFFRISGGLFNPAVTLALWATGAVEPIRATCLFFSQIVGSITASALVLALFPTPLNVRTTLSDGTSLAQGVFIEALMTSELVFTILMLAKEKHKSTFIAPVGIGLALFVAELVGVYYTGGSLNPARSLGPCIVTNQYDSEHWIYWLGPFLGSLFAIGFYKFIKMLEYEMANPGQDGDDENDPTKNPNHEVREKQRMTTAKVLSSLGYPGLDEPQAQSSIETMRQAEEGVFYGSRATSSLEVPDEPDRRVNAGLALSTVASMSDMQSPVRAGYAPSETASSERKTQVGSPSVPGQP